MASSYFTRWRKLPAFTTLHSLFTSDSPGTPDSHKLHSSMQKYRSKETFLDTLWRYRGVMLVTCVPVVLLLAIYVLMPRTLETSEQQLQDRLVHTPDQHRSVSSTVRYAVVLDAGSTGSRVHVYEFLDLGAGNLKLQKDTFEQLKPGLSAYPDDPESAAQSLKPLLDKAVSVVPEPQQASTTIELRATAGLRALSEGKADRILAAVRVYLAGSPFKFDDSKVTILDGEDEGAYAWLTLNYLLGHVGKSADETVAAIDMGGGSIQKAYAVSDAVAAAAPKGYIKRLNAGATAYNIYVHSWLGYGLMAGRAKVLASVPDSNKCLPQDVETSAFYEYQSKQYPLKPYISGGEFMGCAAHVLGALNKDKSCGVTKQLECAFDGVWDGAGSSVTAFYVSSYFFDRAIETGIVPDANARSHETTPSSFKAAAENVCKVKLEEIAVKHPKVETVHAAYLCLDLSYAYTMLTDGLGVKPDARITLVKQIQYNGEWVEAAWALGAAIASLSSS